MDGVALHVNEKDNVATVFINGVTAGQTLPVRDHRGNTESVQTNAPIPYGHKVALRAIHPGEPVVKYGQQIGLASREICPGDHVHIHNMDSARGRGDL